MRLIQWLDDDGYRRQSLVRDDDPDDMAEYGIPLDPPSLAELDIPEEVKRDLHNELSVRGLLTWTDVMAQQNGVTGVVKAVAGQHDLSEPDTRALRRAVLALYRR
ncbi:MAG: hypothetical protein GTO22_24140 [Gemmatimonadales bacterium]|nr:hypothetical protein [Gemmatimonadales bacterium]